MKRSSVPFRDCYSRSEKSWVRRNQKTWLLRADFCICFKYRDLKKIPGAIIVERWSARKWIARIMISWGIVTILTGFVRTASQFYAARFLLGVADVQADLLGTNPAFSPA